MAKEIFTPEIISNARPIPSFIAFSPSKSDGWFVLIIFECANRGSQLSVNY